VASALREGEGALKGEPPSLAQAEAPPGGKAKGKAEGESEGAGVAAKTGANIKKAALGEAPALAQPQPPPLPSLPEARGQPLPHALTLALPNALPLVEVEPPPGSGGAQALAAAHRAAHALPLAVPR
jgi:hypothetical protein